MVKTLAGVFQASAGIPEAFRVAQFHGGQLAQAQPNGEESVRADAFAHRERALIQRIKRFAPRFPAMDVGAIGEVPTVI